MNILVTSLSRKVPLVEALREALARSGEGGLVWGADSDPECVGRHFTDRFWDMPPLSEPDTGERLVRFCREEGIGLVVPTRDGELPFFARLRDELAEAGVHVPVGRPEAVETCLDKLAFFDHCRGIGVPSAPTALTLDELDGESFVVKDRRGAASAGMAIGLGRQAALEHAAGILEPVFQPLLGGVEHSVDVYVNLEGTVVDAAPRTRIRVSGGESTVTETVEHPQLVAASVRVAESLELRGHLVLQGFARGAEVTLLECNPRAGGASTLGFAAGIESPDWAIAEAGGELVEPRLGAYRRGLRLVRYPVDRLIEP